MERELWAVEGKATPLTDPGVPRKVFDLAHNETDARQKANRFHAAGYKVFAWNMAVQQGSTFKVG